MSDYIPPAIVSDNILTRLPAISLLRFRCVCKSWLTLIDSPGFVNSHLNRNISTKSNTYIVTNDFGKLHLYSLDGSLAVENTVVDFQLLSHIAASKKYEYVEVLGSVNGIVCFVLDMVNVVFWNPATRKLFRLPFICSDRLLAPDAVQTGPETPNFGFGYDPVGDDFKVFRLTQCWRVSEADLVGSAVLDSDVKIFSLKSTSWTRARGFRLPLRYEHENGHYACGALHWFVKIADSPFKHPKEKSDLIMAFDLGTEMYQVFPQPDYLNQITRMKFITLGGCIGVVCDHKPSKVDVWIMKEYAVKKSWTRLFSVRQCEYARPVCYSKDGRRVLIEKDLSYLVWYDLKEKKVKKSGMRGTPQTNQESFLYVESMIQLPSLSDGGLKKQKKITEKATEKRIIEEDTEKRIIEEDTEKRDEILIGEFKLVL